MISVIIPIYNTEKYLEDCINSVLKQTIDDYEIILVNDGSTDNSIKIAEQFCDTYCNIHLINQANQGQGAARNSGIAVAKGEYLYFLDSDDMIENNLFEICLEKMTKNDLDIVFFGHKYYYESDLKIIDKANDVYVNTWIDEDEVLDGKEFFRREISTKRISPGTCRQLYRKKFIYENKILYSEGVYSEDIEFFAKALMKAKRVMNLQKALYIWRRRPNSTTTAETDFKRINSLQIIISKLFNLFYEECSNDLRIRDIANRFLKHHIQILTDKFINYKDHRNEYFIKIFNEDLKKFEKLFGNYLSDNDFCFWGEQTRKVSNALGYKTIRDFINLIDEDVATICTKGLYKIDSIKIKCLKDIPFYDKNKKIGIYGIGQHTKSLLKYYKENINHIESEIIFIDSFKGFNNEKFQGKSVINIKDINKYNFNCILISSFGSEEKMYNNLVNELKQKIKIVKIYGDKYDFSLFV